MRWSSVKEMSEEALLNSHFEIGEEMRRRNEGWRTCWLDGGWWGGQQDQHKWPEINWNQGSVYAEGHRQGVQVKGLLGRNPEIEKCMEQKMHVLRQTPLDDSRVIPRYICSKLIDHFVPWSVFGDLDNTSIMIYLTLDCFFESLNMNLW